MITGRILYFIIFTIGRSVIIAQKTHSIDCFQSLKLEFFKSRLYQAIIMYENSNGTSTFIDEMTKFIWTELPSITLSDDNVFNFNNYTSLSLLSETEIGRATNLFVFLYTSNLSYILKTIDYVFETSQWSMYRQKFLIVSSSEVDRDILNHVWKVWQLLGVTIFQTTDQTHSIHQYNPFIDKYKTNICTKDTEWFPDKLKNLHRYALTVHIQNDPPFCLIERNKTGHVIKTGGTEYKIMELLAKMMNFQAKLLVRSGSRFCDNGADASDDCFQELNHRRVDLFANHRPHQYLKTNRLLTSFSRALFISVSCPVVPVLYDINDSRQSAILVIGMSVLLLIIILTRFGNWVDRRIWTVHNLVGVFLGIPVNQTVNKTVDRVLFADLIIASSLYMTLLFNELMHNALNIETEVEFDDFREFKRWNITPMTDHAVAPSDHWISYSSKIGDGVNVSHWGTKKDCLHTLTSFKNVSCLMGQLEGSGAILFDESRRNKKGKKRSMKIMKRCLWSTRASITMRKGSPYLGKIDASIELIRQSGIHMMLIATDTWRLTLNNHSSEDDMERAQLSHKNMFYVVWDLGWRMYLFDVLIFLMELLFHRVVWFKNLNKMSPKLSMKSKVTKRVRKNNKVKHFWIDA